MGRPFEWTNEQADWVLSHVGLGYPTAYVEAEFEKEFGIRRSYITLNAFRKRLVGHVNLRGLFAAESIGEKNKRTAKSRRADYERRERKRLGFDREPTERETEIALEWLRENTPCCASLARDRCRILSGYHWEFDQVKKLAKENGLRITKLAADSTW